MQTVFDYYVRKRQGTLQIVTGRKPALHRFRGRDRTLREIGEITGISRTAIYECMYRLKIPAEEAVARIEARREALARKRLMKILSF